MKKQDKKRKQKQPTEEKIIKTKRDSFGEVDDEKRKSICVIKWHRRALKWGLLVSLIVCAFSGIALFAGLSQQGDIPRKDIDSKKTFYQSELFASQLNYWSENLASYITACHDEEVFEQQIEIAKKVQDLYHACKKASDENESMVCEEQLADYLTKIVKEYPDVGTEDDLVAVLQHYLSMDVNENPMAEYEYGNVDELNDLTYLVSEEDLEDAYGNVSANFFKDSANDEHVIVYDIKSGNFDAHTQKMIDSGVWNIPDYVKKEFAKCDFCSKITFMMPVKYGLNKFTALKLCYWSAKREILFEILFALFGIGSIVLLGALIYFEDKNLRWLERRNICFRMMLAAGIVAACVLAFYPYYYLLYYGRNQWVVFSSMTGFVISWLYPLLLLTLGYHGLCEILLSFVRNIKSKTFFDSLLLVRAAHVINRWIKKMIQTSTNVYSDLVLHRSLLRQLILYVVVVVGVQIILFCFVLGAIYENWIEWLLLDGVILIVIDILGIRVYYKQIISAKIVFEGTSRIRAGQLDYKIPTEQLTGTYKNLAHEINEIGVGLDKAVENSLKNERMKAELITNVSHDIKTPLTSIISYVDLIKREEITEEPLKSYIDVLEKKSERLKQLIEDLVEASKASTGNIELELMNLDMVELVNQTKGEFEDKFKEKQLELIANVSEPPIVVYADGRRLYRVIENIFQNVYKYAMPHTRVYLDVVEQNETVALMLKNISEAPLNVDVSELTQRFVRGDESRTTEGSGLGLSIAENLTLLQHGTFDITVDGDLFKVKIVFPTVKQ